MTFAHFRDEQGELAYREQLSPWARWLAAFIGMGMLVIPLIALHHFTVGAGILNLLAVGAAVLLPTLAALFFIGLALAGAKQLRFDTPQRRVHLSMHGPLGRREKQIDYRRIASIRTVKREGMDEPPHFVILLEAHGHRALALGNFASQAEAEHWQRRLLAEIRSDPGAC